MTMRLKPLRYEISEWHQLANCQSNTSTRLHIVISDILKDDYLSGVRISVVDESIGPVFTYLIDADGTALGNTDIDAHYLNAYDSILMELKRFGFDVVYNPKEHLSVDQVKYLKNLQGLGFDKLRVLYVRSGGVARSHIVVFNVDTNPNWIDNTYAPTESEFVRSLSNGSASDITHMSKTKQFTWGWLNFVANIQDIIDDNVNTW